MTLWAAHFSQIGRPACLPIDARRMFVAIPQAPIDGPVNNHGLTRDPSLGMCRPGARESRGGRRDDGCLTAVEPAIPQQETRPIAGEDVWGSRRRHQWRRLLAGYHRWRR